MSERKFADFVFRSYTRRKTVNALMCLLLVLAAILAVVPLFSVFAYVIRQGAASLRWGLFTELPKPVGESGGGMANAIVGSGVLVGLACMIGVPWGICSGIYLSEYGRGRMATVVRFSVDLLSSIPSIIIGLFVYTLLVIPMRRFSALAGGLALGILMVPTVARTTEELLKIVPVHIREAGLALGIPRWKVILLIVLRGIAGSVITGVILSVARVAGETAPLLFTALGNRYWHQGLDQPIASIPVQIYNYAISPYEEWHQQAWGAALVLVLLVVGLNLATRIALQRGKGGMA